MATYHAIVKTPITIGHGGAQEKLMRGEIIANLVSGSTLETEIGTGNIDNISARPNIPNGKGTSN
ncbi:MAG TPA: hypothetical protein VGI66_03635 [Streptosporangiaceae bacterium]|jgi:hypothetical protein